MSFVSSVRRASFAASVAIAGLSLSGCGGGGGGSSSGPATPTNAAPQFTSPVTATVTENATSTVLNLTANDANGDPVTFAISGGADAGALSLSGTALSFRQTPDFERPADSNRDNIYNLTVTAQDGRGGSTSANLAISVLNNKEGIAVTRVATGFNDPAGLGFLLSLGPTGFVSEGRIAVAQTDGQIFDVNGTTGARTLLADVFDGRPRGRLLAIGFNDRRNNFYSGLYAVAQEPGGRVFVQRYTRSPLPELEMLPTGSAPVSATIFEGVVRGLAGGDLYMTLSDEGGNFAQNPGSPLGKLIFLESQDPFAGASFGGSAGYVARIIGNGMRRSGGAGAVNGHILLSDQGGSLEQEMTFFLPDTRPLDFGWPGREGTQGIGANPPAAVNGPTLAYGFGSGADEGTGIVFGGLYRGPIADLDNRYVFGDRSGTFWSVRFSDLVSGFLLGPQQLDRRTEDFVADVGQIESPVGFVVDDLERLFVLDSDGELFRVDAA